MGLTSHPVDKLATRKRSHASKHVKTHALQLRDTSFSQSSVVSQAKSAQGAYFLSFGRQVKCVTHRLLRVPEHSVGRFRQDGHGVFALTKAKMKAVPSGRCRRRHCRRATNDFATWRRGEPLLVSASGTGIWSPFFLFHSLPEAMTFTASSFMAWFVSVFRMQDSCEQLRFLFMHHFHCPAQLPDVLQYLSDDGRLIKAGVDNAADWTSRELDSWES
eukprot:TRINITY_DN9513_c0_g1_i1.p1 TRINITY_DN9513_c0_g1~~TRINITY_DN9513_c0_g1_i1.p1  ORF type:complete len:217 (+),score=21.37 TRINITY_DN9513_c0_g1_i1:946-1596(+)